MSKSKVATFFPQRRCEIKLQSGGTGLLADKRVTLACHMDLTDGKLLGMPGWLSDEYVLVSKEDSGTDSTKNRVQLEGVEIALYANDTQEEPVLRVPSCNLQGFTFKKGKTKNNGALGAVTLSFAVSTNSYNKKLYDWIPDYTNSTFFAMFSGTQMMMSFGKPTDTDQEEIADEPNQPTIPGTVVAAPKPAEKTSTPGASKSSKKRSPAAQRAADVLDGKSTTKGAPAKK